MKMTLAHLRSLITCVLAIPLLIGCASIPPAEVQTFSSGVTAAKTQTDLAFTAVTDLTSDSIIDYAAAQPTLNDTNFLPVLDPASIATWDKVFSALQEYSQNLVLLTSPGLTQGYEDAVVNLAAQATQTGEDLEHQKLTTDASSTSSSLSGAFTELGSLLLRTKSLHDAKKVLLESDPSIRTIFTTMADALGSPTNNLRGTVHAHWEQRKAGQKVAFLEAKTAADRRTITVQYAGLLNSETTQDLALASLQRSLLALADAHHALAGNQKVAVAAAVAMVEQETQNTLNLANRFQQISKTANTH
jgi:hypothetical protein